MRIIGSLIPVLFIACISCNSHKTRELFNGKNLDGWDTYLGPTRNDSMHVVDSIPVGLNRDPLQVFSVVNVDGAPAIRISGAQHGGLSTKEEFANFHLTIQFKWGERKTPSFKNRKRDSGLLYFAVGPHGADYGAWMRSQEFQIQEGDCGDYWGVAGGLFDIPAKRDTAGRYIYHAGDSVITFSATSKAGRHCIKYPDAEKSTGVWNTVELYCHGDTCAHVINGTLTMMLYSSRQEDNGNITPLKSGKLQLQSEGCEIFYRNISLEAFEKFPSFE